MGPGENAGAVDVGAGHAVAFKVESHNHPSAVEPFQGAATGVGGILRDVFALGSPADRGARLAAVRRALTRSAPATCSTGWSPGSATTATRSGCPPWAARSTSRRRTSTTAWSTRCAWGWRGRTAWCASAAAGPGNLVVLLGASTGRDGIGGASVLASAELAEGEEKRPSVQIGDPFEEKKLMECCLELLDRGLLVALQDLGAAGLTSSSAEMASAGGVGIDLAVDRVPLREADMEPFEIMISESQERMLAVVEPASARRRDRRSASGGRRAPRRSERSPTPARTSGAAGRATWSPTCPCPRWSTRARCTTSSPSSPTSGCTATEASLDRGADPDEILLGPARLRRASPRSAGRSSSTTRSSSRGPCAGPGSADAAVLRLDETGSAIAVAIDGNGRRVACDPYRGTIEAVLECAQNLACVGAEPLGLTNCLNFGNPEKPHVAWQLDRSVQGLADACAALGVPVVGGNVSLYNETEAGPIYPTPVVGMVGELPDPARARRNGAARGRRDRAGGAVRALAGRIGAGEAARRPGNGLPGVSIEAVARRDRAGARGRARGDRDGRPRRQRRRPRLRPGRVRDRGRAWASASTSIALVELRGARGRDLPVRRGPGRVRDRRRGDRRQTRSPTEGRSARYRRACDRGGRGRPDRDLRRGSRGLGRARRRRASLALASPGRMTQRVYQGLDVVRYHAAARGRGIRGRSGVRGRTRPMASPPRRSSRFGCQFAPTPGSRGGAAFWRSPGSQRPPAVAPVHGGLRAQGRCRPSRKAQHHSDPYRRPGFRQFSTRTMPKTMRLLAGHGTTFTNSIVTTPLCCPSRATSLTGQYGHNHGVLRTSPGYPDLREKRNVLPVWLHRAGYRTAHIGKYLNEYSETARPGGRRTRLGRMGHRPERAGPPLLQILAVAQRPEGELRASVGRPRDPRVEPRGAQVDPDLRARGRPLYLQLDQRAPHRSDRGSARALQ